MPNWLKQWLPSLILPVLALAWYAMDDRASMRQRIAFLERDQQVILAEHLGKRMLTLEVHMQTLVLSVDSLEKTLRIFATERLGP